MSTPARTTQAAVVGILVANYDAKKKPSLLPFIQAASDVVDQVKKLSLGKSRVISRGGLTTTTLQNIETWLAAHFYCINDPLYISRSTQGATGAFQRAAAKDGFSSTDYGKQALSIDWSGCLRNIDLAQFASMLLPAPQEDAEDDEDEE